MYAIALGLLLTSLSVSACPDLAGKYATCLSESGEFSGALDLVVTQTAQNRAMIYTFSSTDAQTQERETETFYADGKTKTQSETDPETGTVIALSTTVSCVGKELRAKMVLTFGREVYSTLLTTFKKEGDTLIQTVLGKDMGEEIQEKVICR